MVPLDPNLEGSLTSGLHALEPTKEQEHCQQVEMEDVQYKPVTPEPSPAPSPAPSPVPSPLLDKISLPGANHVEVCSALVFNGHWKEECVICLTSVLILLFRIE